MPYIFRNFCVIRILLHDVFQGSAVVGRRVLAGCCHCAFLYRMYLQEMHDDQHEERRD